MVKLALLIFAIVVLVLLAGNWVISTAQVRWSYGALASFAAAFLPFTDPWPIARKAPAPPA